MSSAAAAGQRAFGLDRGLPFPLADIADARTRCCWSASNLAETMPPVDAAPRRPAARRRQADRRRPARDADGRAAPTLHLQLAPGTDLALANGLLHVAITRGARSTRSYIARADRRLRARSARRRRAYWPDRVERITGVPVERDLQAAAHLLGAERPRAMILTGARRRAAQPGHRHGARRSSTSRSRSGMPAGRAAATAASPARATGRAGASTGRRPTSCPATGASTIPPRARTSPASGASTRTSCPARAGPRTSCSTRWAPTAACGRCSSWARTSSCPAPHAGHVEERLRRPRLPRRLPTLPVRDGRAAPTSCCPWRSGPRRTAR